MCDEVDLQRQERLMRGEEEEGGGGHFLISLQLPVHSCGWWLFFFETPSVIRSFSFQVNSMLNVFGITEWRDWAMKEGSNHLRGEESETTNNIDTRMKWTRRYNKLLQGYYDTLQSYFTLLEHCWHWFRWILQFIQALCGERERGEERPDTEWKTPK